MNPSAQPERTSEDLLIDLSAKAVIFYQENKTRVLTVLITLLVLVGSVIGISLFRAQSENEATVLLGTAEGYLSRGDYEAALDGSELDLTIGFHQIVERYGSTKSGNMARYYAAIAHFELGDMELAESYLSEYDPPDGIMGVGPIALQGEILTELGRHAEAAEAFVEASEWNVNETTTPAMLLEAAESWKLAGETDKSMQIVDRILADYPLSQQVARAEWLKGELVALAN